MIREARIEAAPFAPGDGLIGAIMVRLRNEILDPLLPGTEPRSMWFQGHTDRHSLVSSAWKTVTGHFLIPQEQITLLNKWVNLAAAKTQADNGHLFTEDLRAHLDTLLRIFKVRSTPARTTHVHLHFRTPKTRRITHTRMTNTHAHMYNQHQPTDAARAQVQRSPLGN